MVPASNRHFTCIQFARTNDIPPFSFKIYVNKIEMAKKKCCNRNCCIYATGIVGLILVIIGALLVFIFDTAYVAIVENVRIGFLSLSGEESMMPILLAVPLTQSEILPYFNLVLGLNLTLRAKLPTLEPQVIYFIDEIARKRKPSVSIIYIQQFVIQNYIFHTTTPPSIAVYTRDITIQNALLCISTERTIFGATSFYSSEQQNAYCKLHISEFFAVSASCSEQYRYSVLRHDYILIESGELSSSGPTGYKIWKILIAISNDTLFQQKRIISRIVSP